MERRRVRRAFQHWSIIVLGILIPAAALLGESTDIDVPMNATLLSLVLLGSTVFEVAGLHRCQDVSEFVCGAWLVVSPFAFGYADAGQLRYWHVASGALLMLLAIFNLWKDYNRAGDNSTHAPLRASRQSRD
jgi:SPW repeat